MSIESLRLAMPLKKALAKIDTMRRLANNKSLWLVASSDCPIAAALPSEEEELNAEMLALLHYARIGVLAAHNKS